MRLLQPDLPLLWASRSRVSPYLWVILLWLLLITPTIFIRGAHYEEGTTIGLARGAFEDGHWLAPHLYGLRFVERPVLVSWVLGVVGLVSGDLSLWVGRLPAVLALLGGGCLVYWLARRAAGAHAALFGPICFFVSPMMLQKLVTAENDGVVSVLLFAAFVIWWIGSAKGGPSLARWLGIDLILVAAGLVKGPQPLGFFFLGVGLYLVVRRRWREFGALVLTGILPALVIGGWYWAVYQPGDLATWQAQSRLGLPDWPNYAANVVRFAGQLALALLPGILLAVPLAIDLWRQRIDANRDLVLALLCYAGACTLVLLFWPHAGTRYAMPAVSAVATLAGLGFHHYLARLPRLVWSTQAVAATLLVYALIVNWVVVPLFPYLFEGAADEARPIVDAILERPAPVYVVPYAVNRDVLYYLPKPRLVEQEEIAHAKPPFWAILTEEQEQALKAARPDLQTTLRLGIPEGGARLVEVTKP